MSPAVSAGVFSLKCKISLIVGIFCTHSSRIHVWILLKKLGLNVGFSHWQYERVKVDSTSCSLLTDWAATYIHLLSLLGDTLAFSLWVWKCDSSKNFSSVFILQLISLRLISDVRCDVMWRRWHPSASSSTSEELEASHRSLTVVSDSNIMSVLHISTNITMRSRSSL